MKILFSPPDITEEEISEVVDTLRSGWITTGPKTKEFERKIADYCGTEKAVCLNSATAGLELILRILGIGEGDEVITSAYTYTASASVIAHVGAKIVLCDVGKDSYEMDTAMLERLITDKTKAIIAVDIAGVPCNYEKIYEIINRKTFFANNEIQSKIGRIALIADAAHSFGAIRGGIKSGSLADFTSFSFHAVKNLTTAEGGAVVWNKKLGLEDVEIYQRFMLWSLHGQSKDALAKTTAGAWEYDIILTGYKCNMTDIMAAIGLVQLKRYFELLEKRRKIVEIYDKNLRNSGIDTLKHYEEDYSSSGHLYLTRIQGADIAQRNQIIAELAKYGIPVNVHYKPLPLFTAYRNLGFKIEDYPNAFDLYKNAISLPCHTLLTEDNVKYVALKLKECVSKLKGMKQDDEGK